MYDTIRDKVLNFDINERAYVYFEEVICRRINELKECFSDWSILYSVKANPNRDIINCCYNNGLGFDVATIRELDLLLQYKNHGLLQFSCPGKSDSDLKKAMQSNCILVADSIGELNKIWTLHQLINSKCEYGIRLNIGDKNDQLTESMVGEDSHFGITLDELLEYFATNKNIVPIRHIHVYSGSQILDEIVLSSNFSSIAKAVVDLIDRLNLSIKSVSFGGGFGIPYNSVERRINFSNLKNLVENNLYINKLKYRNVSLCIESGRYIVAECGYYISIVRDVKFRNHTQVVIIDGLMNAFFRPIFLNTFHNVYTTREGDQILSKIVGNTCTPLDSFPFLVKLPKVNVGDKLIFENAGAYGLSMTPTDFISSNEVSEIYVK